MTHISNSIYLTQTPYSSYTRLPSSPEYILHINIHFHASVHGALLLVLLQKSFQEHLTSLLLLSSQGPIEHLLYTRCCAWHLECDYKLNRHILCLHQAHNLVQETDIKQTNRDIYN